ncbi:MAG: HDOD domain-containing protein [Rhodocyclaceae bacterium]|nr:HDOD domain-containing protein [Rhodocyclaceae bacterium]MDZ4216096.1 HDOD domain-containing protein [Rhodocyclaceae bacterium]
MTTEPRFPLVTLQPLTDANQAWVALRLCGEQPLDTPSLAHVLSGFGLADILVDLPCVACIDPAGFDPAPLAPYVQRLQLALTAAAAADATLEPARAVLSAAGYTLVSSDDVAQTVQTIAAAAPQKKEASTRSLLLKLMTLVTSDADTDEIEALIKRDPNLSYQLLKLVNSVAFAPGKKITSFGQAIALLGRRQLQRWLQLLLYARQAGSQHASPLLPRAAQRAGLMEALAKRQGLAREMRDHAFMVGMFSLLDQLFGMPVAEVIAPLNLPDPVVQGLTTGEGSLGGLLAIVVASDGLPTPALGERIARLGIAREDWAAAQVEALRWAVQVSKEA